MLCIGKHYKNIQNLKLHLCASGQLPNDCLDALSGYSPSKCKYVHLDNI